MYRTYFALANYFCLKFYKFYFIVYLSRGEKGDTMSDAPQGAMFNAEVFLRVASPQKLIELLNFFKEDWDEINSASFRAQLLQFLDHAFPTESIVVAQMPATVRRILLELGFLILWQVRQISDDDLRVLLYDMHNAHMFDAIRAVAPSAN